MPSLPGSTPDSNRGPSATYYGSRRGMVAGARDGATKGESGLDDGSDSQLPRPPSRPSRAPGLRLVGAIKQLRPDRGPVLLQVRGQCTEAHAIDACGPLVALNLRQRLSQIVSLDNRFHRRPTGRPAFDFGCRRSGFGPFRAGASGFTPRPGS